MTGASPGPPDETVPSEEAVSWGALFAETRQRLTSAGLVEIEVSARRIVEAASGYEGAEFALGLDQPATVKGVARLDAMVARRSRGEPLQYVVGSWAFRHLDLLVDRRVLIPRPETEIVAGKALEELGRPAMEPAPLVADLGTGSGAIGLSIAFEHHRAAVWLTDSSPDALAVARANLAGLGRAGSRVNLAQGSWFEALGPDLVGRFSVVVSNPPYVATSETLPSEVAEWEPAEALLAGPDGLDDLRKLVTGAPRWLRPEGALVLEIGETQTQAVVDLAGPAFDQVEVFDDLAGRPRGIVARHPRSAGQ